MNVPYGQLAALPTFSNQMFSLIMDDKNNNNNNNDDDENGDNVMKLAEKY